MFTHERKNFLFPGPASNLPTDLRAFETQDAEKIDLLEFARERPPLECIGHCVQPLRNTSIQTAPPDIESPPVSVPAGTPENSPAIYRWVWAPP